MIRWRRRSTSTRVTAASRRARFGSRRTSGRTESPRRRSIGSARATSRCSAPGCRSNASRVTACRRGRGARVVQFPPFRVTYRAGGRDVRLFVPWQPLRLSSRLPDETTARRGHRRHRTAARALVRAFARSAAHSVSRRGCRSFTRRRRPRRHGALAAVVARRAPPAATLAARALAPAGGGRGTGRRRGRPATNARRPRDTPGRGALALPRTANTGPRLGTERTRPRGRRRPRRAGAVDPERQMGAR